MRKILPILFVTLLVLLFFFTPESECADVARIHVIANSDSEEDIYVKLRVAEAVAELLSDNKFDDMKSIEAGMLESLPEVTAVCNKTLADNGMDYTACAEVGVYHFEKKSLGADSFPEGDYLSLVVTLGEGGGHNWWSVMFPDISFEASMAMGEDGRRGRTVVLGDGRIVKIRSVIYDIFKLMLTKR